MSARIHCLIHPKEGFTPQRAGAFALNVQQSTLASRFSREIAVYGAPVDQPFKGIDFVPVRPSLPLIFGNNMSFARGYARQVRDAPPAIIECFNRPVIAAWLAHRFPASAVSVYFGNDPQKMTGSDTPALRQRLVDHLARVYCVSRFIRDRFCEGLQRNADKCVVLYTGMDPPAEPEPKQPIIVFAGRMVPEKGGLELIEALKRVLPRHPAWSAHLIGAKWFAPGQKLTPFEETVAHAAAAQPAIKLLGFLPNNETMQHFRRAAIAVVPSNWDDPFPRTAVEALSAGCALICSRRGGLSELGERAHYLDAVTHDEIESALQRLITDDAYRADLQTRATADFPFTLEQTVAAWDAQRASLLAHGGGKAA